jgi:hypothetical protein
MNSIWWFLYIYLMILLSSQPFELSPSMKNIFYKKFNWKFDKKAMNQWNNN